MRCIPSSKDREAETLSVLLSFDRGDQPAKNSCRSRKILTPALKISSGRNIRMARLPWGVGPTFGWNALFITVVTSPISLPLR